MSEAGAIKTALLCWLRFGKQFPYLATEAGRNNSDVLGASLAELVEIEVKVSAVDLKKDFQKQKHEIYKNLGPTEKMIEECVRWSSWSRDAQIAHEKSWIPNKFYFAVPKELAAFADEYTIGKHAGYGLMAYDRDQGALGGITVVRRAKWLHKDAPPLEILTTIAKRMGSELCNHAIYARSSEDFIARLELAGGAASKFKDVEGAGPED